MNLCQSIVNNALNLTPKGGKVYSFDFGQKSIRNQIDEIVDYKCWMLPIRPRRVTNKYGFIKKTYNVVMTITSRNNGSQDVDIQDTNNTVNNLMISVDDFAESFYIKLGQDPLVNKLGDLTTDAVYFQDDNMRTGVLLNFSFETKYIQRDYCLTGVLDYMLWDDGVIVLWDDGSEVEFS